MKSLLCFLGWHNWRYIRRTSVQKWSGRICTDCELTEVWTINGYTKSCLRKDVIKTIVASSDGDFKPS